MSLEGRYSIFGHMSSSHHFTIMSRKLFLERGQGLRTGLFACFLFRYTCTRGMPFCSWESNLICNASMIFVCVIVFESLFPSGASARRPLTEGPRPQRVRRTDSGPTLSPSAGVSTT